MPTASTFAIVWDILKNFDEIEMLRHTTEIRTAQTIVIFLSLNETTLLAQCWERGWG
ncbi:hypothetical protein C1752_00186 [Acaryochloris thomasi RCC1774]|uniref:Uncharacterized protein n=1 Tax=Acaryochloris thomasi RCC1774 TaxID=1764569 RepID=A0A2W1K7X2_9CYAN|nr:hypothetical protein C1752_00186 [Acaryochloris thomasi RCC1774]